MKNHWLKNKDKNVEVGENIEANELASVETTPVQDIYVSNSGHKFSLISGDVSMGFGKNADAICISTSEGDKIEDAIVNASLSTWNYPQFDFGATVPEVTPTPTPDHSLEIGIPYKREIKIGPFTFKDAGVLGVDIFIGEKKHWLNAGGEKELLNWLSAKADLSAKNWNVTKENLSVKTTDKIVDNAFYNQADYNKKAVEIKKSSDKKYSFYTQTVSNENAEITSGLGFRTVCYKLTGKHIVPGSVLCTAYSPIHGNLGNYDIPPVGVFHDSTVSSIVAWDKPNPNYKPSTDGRIRPSSKEILRESPPLRVKVEPRLEHIKIDYEDGIVMGIWDRPMQFHTLLFCYECKKEN